MFPNRIRSLAATLLFCCAAPAIACTETGAFGFRFGQQVPAGAPQNVGVFGYDGGPVLARYRVEAPASSPDFPIYAVGAIANRRAVYEVIAIRLISDKALMSTPDDNPERQRVEDAAKLEVSALLKQYSEKYGFKYEKTGYPDSFKWIARTPALESRIGVGGIQSIYIECLHKGIYDSEVDITRKARGGLLF